MRSDIMISVMNRLFWADGGTNQNFKTERCLNAGME